MSDTTQSPYTGFLDHSGVKGMKWGVRKDVGHEGETASTKDIAKADKKYEKTYRSGMSSYIKVNNTFAGHINPMLDELNSNPKYKDKNLFEDKKLHDAYFKDYEKVVSKAAAKTMESFGTNASGTREMSVTRYGFGENSTWAAELVDVKHADQPITSFLVTPKFNKTGHIIGQTLSALEAKHGISDGLDFSAMTYDEFLEHHGIKGQKWGVRKSTRAGRQTYSDDLDRARKSVKNEKRQLKSQKEIAKNASAGRKAIEQEKYQQMMKAHLNNPDRATALRFKQGEVAAVGVLSTVLIVGSPILLGGTAVTVIRRKHIEKKQENGGYN